MTDSFKILMGIWILTDKLFNANVLLLDLVEEKVEGWGGKEAADWGPRNTWPYLAYFGFCLLGPHPHRSPFFVILTGNKIYGLSIVSELQLHSILPSPFLFAELSLTSPLGLSKNKESLQGREWVGTAHREYAEPQMWGSSVQCSSVFSRAMRI